MAAEEDLQIIMVLLLEEVDIVQEVLEHKVQQEERVEVVDMQQDPAAVGVADLEVLLVRLPPLLEDKVVRVL